MRRFRTLACLSCAAAACFGGGGDGGGAAGRSGFEPDAGGMIAPDAQVDDRPFDGTLPAPGPVAYRDETGREIEVEAHPGYLVLLAAFDADASDVARVAAAASAQVVMSFSEGSVHWLEVMPGDEGGAIDALRNDAAVFAAFPLAPLEMLSTAAPSRTCGSAIAPPSTTARAFVLDGFLGTHGAEVDGIASMCDGRAVETSCYDIECQPPRLRRDVGPLLAEIARSARAQERTVAVNLSFGWGHNRDCFDRRTCTDAACSADKEVTLGFWREWLHAMESRYLDDPSSLDRVIVTIAAGNEGLDVTDQIAYLKATYPNAWRRVILVSTTDAPGRACNDSRDLDDMIYADANATSFATPQVTCLAAAVAEEVPTATAEEIKRAIFAAATADGNRRTLPTVEDVKANLGAACMPMCTGRMCGDDGCGGSCGTCNPGEGCVDWTCMSTGPCGGVSGTWTIACPDGGAGCDPDPGCGVSAYSASLWIAPDVALSGGSFVEGDRTYTFDPTSCTLSYVLDSTCGSVSGSFSLSDGTGSGEGQYYCYIIETNACTCVGDRVPDSCTITQDNRQPLPAP